MDLIELANKGAELFLPNLSIDIAVIGFRDNELKILLLEFDGRWMLPGGYILLDESIDVAANRVLRERTGLSRYYLKIFQVFGDADRSFADELRYIFAKANLPWSEGHWMAQRYVSTAYYALVDINLAKPTHGIFAQKFAWHSLKDLPEMWFDHKKIAKEALLKLKIDISVNQQSCNLLPERFTMPELHSLHEQILDKKLDRSRFQKKMLSLGVFERLSELKEGVPHKRPFLYRFKEEADSLRSPD